MIATPKIDWKARARPNKAKERDRILSGGPYEKALMLPGEEMIDVERGFELGTFNEDTRFLFFERDKDLIESMQKKIIRMGLEDKAVLIPDTVEKTDMNTILTGYRGLTGGFDFVSLDLCGTINDKLAGWLASQNATSRGRRFLKDGAFLSINTTCALRANGSLAKTRFPEALGEASKKTLSDLIECSAKWPLSLKRAQNENVFYSSLITVELEKHCLWQFDLELVHSHRYHDTCAPMLTNNFIVNKADNKSDDAKRKLSVLLDALTKPGLRYLSVEE